MKSTIPTVKHRGGSIMLGHFVGKGNSGLLKIVGTMMKEDYLETLKQHLKTSAKKLKHGSPLGLPAGQ